MSSSSNLPELIKNGALIIDLRTASAYEQEHISDSLNIPFESLNSKLLKSNFIKFRKKETIITCSSKAEESTAAKNMMESQGMLYVYDGGIWQDLQKSLS